MTGIGSPPGKVQGRGIVRDRHGRPRLGPDQVDKYWHLLTVEDVEHLQRMYPDHPRFRKE